MERIDWNRNENQSSRRSLPSDFNIGNFLRNEKLLAAAKKYDRSLSSTNESTTSPSLTSSNQISLVDLFVKFDYWTLDLEYMIWFDLFLDKN